MDDLATRFIEGGIFMWPILICSAIGLALGVERYLFLKNARRIEKDQLLKSMKSTIMKGDIQRAIAVVSQEDSPLTNIVRAGLISVSNNGKAEEVQTAMDAVALREVPAIEKKIGLLATLSNVATLLGLLGTVEGLIGAFAAVAGVSPSEKAELLAKSISAAMNTTAFGLVVAIPLLAAFGYLSSMAQEIIDDVHESSVSILNFILSHKDKFYR
ncbi:MAG: MotA/TolQ/ExbB proton channel family protein [Bdellovibrionales bacterium]